MHYNNGEFNFMGQYSFAHYYKLPFLKIILQHRDIDFQNFLLPFTIDDKNIKLSCFFVVVVVNVDSGIHYLYLYKYNTNLPEDSSDMN